jgi:acyl phosphate:glycerol-3-phosphate acyltransferase
MVIRLLIVVLSYLIGSISSGIVVSRALRLSDPRRYGSNNPGATNVLRSGNKLAAALTLLGDGLKGWCAIQGAMLAIAHFGSPYGLGDETIALAASAVFAGHLFPVFFGFAGGKGVATLAGVLFALDPVLGSVSAATWVVVACLFRYSSLAALATAVLTPLYQTLIFGFGPVSVALLAISAGVIIRHRSNITNLLTGREKRIGDRSD